MYIVGIDPSLSSSAITIHKDGKFDLFNYTNKKSNYKWIKETNNLINYTFHDYTIGNNFSESEVEKIKIYDNVTENLVSNIKEITLGESVKIYMEGYSYSSKGKIIDLVAFSTLIRYKLLKIPNAELTIIPPSSLKSYVGEMVYEKDKKGIYRNDNGKAAGSFDKKDMMEALLKLDISDSYFDYITNNSVELLKPKNIPKPFDDVNDSLILAYYGIISNSNIDN
jgi:hypothetical protein